jgi:hypothetical protein
LYLFGGYLGFPRGFESQPNERLNVFRGDYVMPLFYPDWSLGSLLYIKRFKADLFYDFGRSQIRRRNTQTGSIDWVTRNYESFGAEITTDFHFMRVMFPLSAGVRYIYKPAFSESSFEFVFDIDLFSIYNRQNKY